MLIIESLVRSIIITEYERVGVWNVCSVNWREILIYDVQQLQLIEI